MLAINQCTGHLHVSYLKENCPTSHNTYHEFSKDSSRMKINKSWFKKGQEAHNKLKFANEEIEAIIDLYKSGVPRKDIAKKYNCSSTAIKTVLIENKIKHRNRSEVTKQGFENGIPINNKIKFSNKEISSIISLYISGKTKEEISKMFGCSVTPINRTLVESNIQLRNRKENGLIRAKKYPPWNKGRKMPELSARFEKYGHPCLGKTPWNKGTKGVMKAWNKGLTIEDPRVKRIIEKQTGRPKSIDVKRKISQTVKKLMTEEYKKKISKWTREGMTKDVCRKISKKKKEWIKNNSELAQKYMEPWINSGTYGFGTYATASDGHLCHSSLELWVDEKLTEHGLAHEIHPKIPNSTKFADFLVNDIFIEVDGMGKETEEDWNGKLEVYRKNNLKFIIIKPKDNIDKIIEEIKNGRKN